MLARSFLLSLALVAGCAHNLQPKPVMTPLGVVPGGLVTSAAQRLIYAKPQGGPRICAEPMPDAVMDQKLDTLLELAHKGKVEVKLAAVDVAAESDNSLGWRRELSFVHKELAGRNWSVLLAREFMYRMCELSMNFEPGSAGYEKAAEQYARMAKLVEDIAAAETAKAKARQAEADAALIQVQEAAAQRLARIQGHVARILGRVTRGAGTACTVDAGQLEAMLKDARYDGIRERLKAARNCEDLRARLESADVETQRALAEAP